MGVRFYVFLTFFIGSIYSENYEYTIVTSSGITSAKIQKQVLLWEDIPYAMPPIDDLRWKAPKELFDNKKLIKPMDNNFCIQEPSSFGGASGNTSIVGSEDCLYLDIRAPVRSEKNKLLPVMFWIHGGGNTSGLKDIYDFSGMVKDHNVIVISINYRLGPFGWFTHPSIQDLQNGIDKTSNFGTLDIIQALEWTKKNIKLFGGNPENITIFGESAGGHNVLSLLVAPQAKGLFHKAISQSGYTTSVSIDNAIVDSTSSQFMLTSDKVVQNLIADNGVFTKKELNTYLKSLPAYELFNEYIGKTNSELPLLTNDGIVIPEIGLSQSLSMPEYVHQVPIIAGSNRDEVKLWIGLAEYFVETEFSLLGSIIGIPKVRLKNKDSFEAFNYYRSSAWQIRGVIEPLNSLIISGNNNTFAYRYDWDDHRRFLIADLRSLIGAAHATEIPLLTGNNKLVGDLGYLLYPKGFSKRFTSKNMTAFWTNFAKNSKPGFSSNNIEWKDYRNSNFMIIDRKKDMKLKSFNTSFKSLVEELNFDKRVTELEKCVILYQMGSLIGNDIFDDIKKYALFDCQKEIAIDFLDRNSNFISY